MQHALAVERFFRLCLVALDRPHVVRAALEQRLHQLLRLRLDLERRRRGPPFFVPCLGGREEQLDQLVLGALHHTRHEPPASSTTPVGSGSGSSGGGSQRHLQMRNHVHAHRVLVAVAEVFGGVSAAGAVTRCAPTVRKRGTHVTSPA